MSALKPQRASRIAGVLSLVSEDFHLRIALPHNLAAVLASSDVLAAFNAGRFPSANWQQEQAQVAINRLSQMRKAVLSSAGLTILATGVAVLVAYAMGKLSPDLPIDYGKVANSVGGAFALWAGILAFKAPERTYKGTLLHEVTHSFLVKILFTLGAVAVALGSLWWQ